MMLGNLIPRRALMIATVWCGVNGVLPVGRAMASVAEAYPPVEWIRQFGTLRSEFSPGVAVDDLGNAYISGTTGNSLGGPNAGVEDVFLAKYDAIGNLVWYRQTGTLGIDIGAGVAVDGAGNAQENCKVRNLASGVRLRGSRRCSRRRLGPAVEGPNGGGGSRGRRC